MLLAASCSIQKRHYRPGFFVQGFRQDKAAARTFPENEKKRDTSVQQHGVATAEPGALPVVFAADAIQPADSEMVNPISPDTLLPGKKAKKQLKPLPAETPEETAKRKQNRLETFAGTLLLLFGFVLAVLFGFNPGAMEVITGLIFAIIGILLLLMALISNVRIKQRIRDRTNGLSVDESRKREKALAQNQLLIALSITVAGLILFLLVGFNLSFLYSALISVMLFGGLVFSIVSLIKLLIVIHPIKKQPGYVKPVHKKHGKYFGPGALAITGVVLMVLGLVGLFYTLGAPWFLILIILGSGAAGVVMLLVALLWAISVTLKKE